MVLQIYSITLLFKYVIQEIYVYQIISQTLKNLRYPEK